MITKKTLRAIGLGAASAVVLASMLPAIGQDGAPSLGSLKPRPAEIVPLAAHSLLIDIAQAGDAVVAIGDRGNVVRSTDGRQWTQVAIPVHATLTDVDFIDARHGWIVGHDGVVLHTVDGGQTWALQRFEPAQNQPLLGVVALDALHVVAFGAYGLMLSSVDGGKTWAPVDAPALLEDGLHLNAATRLGNGDVLLVGEIGLLGISADGQTWERLTLPYEGSLFGVLPQGEKGALVFGLRGNVLRTDDVRGGEWTAVDVGTVLSLYGGTRTADGAAVLVGADGVLVRIGADGTSVARTQLEIASGDLSGGSLTAVVAWKDGLLVTGEGGVTTAPVPVTR
jgi:photosystem II stability/assembly factor-like uncharacterized protein